ncbi:MAG TPA: hypothetical protein VEK57_24075 [Thermoanaerobaculia bacterium]|nr:hypothetical protein [Thermoanaerobaculia bacterium]
MKISFVVKKVLFITFFDGEHRAVLPTRHAALREPPKAAKDLQAQRVFSEAETFPLPSS